MKTNKLPPSLFSILLLLMVLSCVNNDDYGTPNITIEEPIIPINKITTFKAIYARLAQAQNNGNSTAIIDLEEELYIEGYVISSDKSGNFYEEIIIQNKTDDNDPTENPRLGIRLSINVASLSDTYGIGRKVYVKLSGLTIGEESGVLTIAKGEGGDVEQLQEFEYQNIVIRSSEVIEITPKVSTISNLTENDENTLIRLENVQIKFDELSKTYAGEENDLFDGFRTLVSCDNLETIELQTSTFADFKSLQVSPLKGYIDGIMTRDFRNNFNVFVINSTDHIHFNNEERCDPPF